MLAAALLALAAVCSLPRVNGIASGTSITIGLDGEGRIPRSKAVVRAFRRANPCPDGPDKGSKTRCRGYVADHAVPLCAGGADAVQNLVWQSKADAAAKDRAEVALCRWIALECGHPWRKK